MKAEEGMEATAQPNNDMKLEFLRTPAGFLRICEAVFALSGLISGAIGSECGSDGRFGFFLFVVIVAFIEAIFVIILFVLRLDAKIPTLNVPLTLFINDGISLFFHFISSLLMMLSIGFCHYRVTARVFASLFSIANFLVLVGLVYIDYNWWKATQPNQQGGNPESGGTTVTETSPTVLT